MGLDPVTSGLIGGGLSLANGLFGGSGGSGQNNQATSNAAAAGSAASGLLGSQGGNPYQQLQNAQGTTLSGYESYMPGLLSQYAAYTGNLDPFAPAYGVQSVDGKNYLSAGGTPTAQSISTNPYSLNANQQQALNGQQDILSNAYNANQNNLVAGMAARGINDPRAIAGSAARNAQNYGGQAAGLQNQAEQSAYNTRVSGLQNIMSGVQGIQNQQNTQSSQALNQIVAALNGLNGSSSNLTNTANTANAMQQYQDSSLGSSLGSILGALTNSGSTGSTGTSANPLSGLSNVIASLW